MRKILLSFLAAAWTFSPIGASAQTINNLGAGTTVTGSDLYPSYQGSNPAVKVTATQLQTFMGTVVQTGPGATGGTCNPGATCTIQTQEIPVTVTSGNITTAISGGLYGELINYNSASDQTPTIPTAASAGNGTYFELCGIQHSQTVTHSSSDTIGGASTYLLPTGTEAAPSCVGLRSDGVSNWNPIPYGGSSGGSGNALFGTTTGNTSGDVVSMSNTTVGVQDSGVLVSNLPSTGTTNGDIAKFSNTTGAFADSGVTVASLNNSHPTPIYTSGNWYAPFGAAQVSVGSSQLTADLYCAFGSVGASVTITSLGAVVVTGVASSHAQFALYSLSGNTLTLVDYITAQQSTASQSEILGSLNNTTDTLTPGTIYAFCENTDINGVIFSVPNASSLSTAQLLGSATQSNLITLIGNITLVGRLKANTYSSTPATNWPSTITYSSMTEVQGPAPMALVEFQVN